MVFINSFLSYLIVFLVFCCAGGLAIFVGITLRKHKNAAEEKQKNKTDTIE